MATRAKLFSQLAKSVDTSGTITSAGISSTVSLGATVYDSVGLLPTSGVNAGDQAFVTSTSRLYINSGVGWYNVAVINNTPIVQSVLDSDGGTTPFSLATDGTPTTITITAVDSDGDPLTYSSTADSDFGGLATISQADNVFTITPFSQDSATTESGTITFSITDGINIANSGIQTFTLSFVNPLWKELEFSQGSVGGNGQNNSAFPDRSANGYTITGSGSPLPIQTAFHPYLDNWSVKFGSGIHHLKNNGGSHFGSADFTIEAWVNPIAPSVTTSTRGIISQYPNTGATGSVWILGIGSNSGSSTKVRIWYNDTSNIESSASLELNQWSHIAWTREGSTNKIFINGELDTTFTNSADYSTNTFQTEIGTWNTVEADRHFQGFISNLRVVDGTALYTSTFTPPTEKLTAITDTTILACHSNRFLFEGSFDSAGWSIVGTPEISAFNPFGQGSEFAPGENKGSVKFNGSSYLSLATSPFHFDTGDYTVECWIYPTVLGRYIMGIWSSVSASNQAWSLRTLSDGKLNSEIDPGDVQILNSSAGDIKINQWTHVALTRNGSDFKLFVNGAVAATATSAGFNMNEGGGFMGIGAVDGLTSSGFVGYISDVYIRKGAAKYTSAFAIPTSPVGNTDATLYAPMDNAAVFDKTGTNTVTVGTNYTTYYKYGTSSSKGLTTTMQVGINETGPWTIEFWWQDPNNNSFALLNVKNSAGQDVLVLDVSVSYGTMYGYRWGLGQPYTGQSTVGPQPPGGYEFSAGMSHVAIVAINGTAYLYHNGTQIGSRSLSGVDMSSNNGTIVISTNRYVDDLQLFPGYAKYTANFTPPTQTQGRTYQAVS